jgi:hypothetical protein
MEPVLPPGVEGPAGTRGADGPAGDRGLGVSPSTAIFVQSCVQQLADGCLLYRVC